jgi:peptidoglycan hydrolase CwlO-like protein
MIKKITISLLCASMVSATVFASNDEVERLASVVKQLTHSYKDLTDSHDTAVKTIRRLGDDLDTETKRCSELRKDCDKQRKDQMTFGAQCFGAGVTITAVGVAVLVHLFKQ